MDLSLYPPGESLPAPLLADVRRLFVASYHRYHYLPDLAEADRLHVLARHEDAVVGYASARLNGDSVHLANLLVDRDHRGGGVGRSLESARYRWAKDTGLPSYVSCTCDSGASQRLKLDMGLRPVALKLGYRRDVTAPGRRGSSVVFTDTTTTVTDPTGYRVVSDPRRSRIRFTGTAADVLEPALRTDPGWYADLLVGPADAQLLHTVPELAFAGADRDAGTGRWHACFQVRNDAFRGGVEARPVVLGAPEPLTVDNGLEVLR